MTYPTCPRDTCPLSAARRSASQCGAASSEDYGPPPGSGRSRRGTGPASVDAAATFDGIREAPGTPASCAPCPGAGPAHPAYNSTLYTLYTFHRVGSNTMEGDGGPVFKRHSSTLNPASPVHYYSAVHSLVPYTLISCRSCGQSPSTPLRSFGSVLCWDITGPRHVAQTPPGPGGRQVFDEATTRCTHRNP